MCGRAGDEEPQGEAVLTHSPSKLSVATVALRTGSKRLLVVAMKILKRVGL